MVKVETVGYTLAKVEVEVQALVDTLAGRDQFSGNKQHTSRGDDLGASRHTG